MGVKHSEGNLSGLTSTLIHRPAVANHIMKGGRSSGFAFIEPARSDESYRPAFKSSVITNMATAQQWGEQ
jgi:hypothetical protein